MSTAGLGEERKENKPKSSVHLQVAPRDGGIAPRVKTQARERVPELGCPLTQPSVVFSVQSKLGERPPPRGQAELLGAIKDRGGGLPERLLADIDRDAGENAQSSASPAAREDDPSLSITAGRPTRTK